MNYVLVTGCNGIVGYHLTKALLKRGHKVIGLSTGKKQIIFHENFNYISIDITNCIELEKIFLKFKISKVIHLAAIAHLKSRKRIDWNEFYRTNTLASKTVFQCALQKGAKIFFASTVDVYGQNNSTIITEECKPNPISDYARSKYLAENILKSMAKKHNHEYIIARFAPVYLKGFMKDVYKRIYLKYPYLSYKINGFYSYHFVSVYNIIDFVITWIESQNVIKGTYNICDPNQISSKEFILLEKGIGNAKLVINIPNKLLTIIRYASRKMYKIFKFEILKKISNNLYKITHPPQYSTAKMKKIMNPKWNMENTIYDIEECK